MIPSDDRRAGCRPFAGPLGNHQVWLEADMHVRAEFAGDLALFQHVIGHPAGVAAVDDVDFFFLHRFSLL